MTRSTPSPAAAFATSSYWDRANSAWTGCWWKSLTMFLVVENLWNCENCFITVLKMLSIKVPQDFVSGNHFMKMQRCLSVNKAFFYFCKSLPIIECCSNTQHLSVHVPRWRGICYFVQKHQTSLNQWALQMKILCLQPI